MDGRKPARAQRRSRRRHGATAAPHLQRAPNDVTAALARPEKLRVHQAIMKYDVCVHLASVACLLRPRPQRRWRQSPRWRRFVSCCYCQCCCCRRTPVLGCSAARPPVRREQTQQRCSRRTDEQRLTKHDFPSGTLPRINDPGRSRTRYSRRRSPSSRPITRALQPRPKAPRA